MHAVGPWLTKTFDTAPPAQPPLCLAVPQVKELKNGRLAMLAFLGFSSQAAVQGKGPIACLQAHLADPGHNNSEWVADSEGGEAGLGGRGWKGLGRGAGQGPH